MQVETRGLARAGHRPCHLHAAASRLSASLLPPVRFLCVTSPADARKGDSPCRCSADANPEGVPFPLSSRAPVTFFSPPLASRF